MEHIYFAENVWDEEAGVWYVSDTDAPGLVAEADSERDLERKICELVAESYQLNRHLFDQPSAGVTPMRMTSSRLETIRLSG